MSTTPYVPNTVEPSSLWRSYTGITAVEAADLFERAAVLVDTLGHNAYGDDDPDPGVNIRQALSAVAVAYTTASACGATLPAGAESDLVDELERRLAGVLVVTRHPAIPANGIDSLPFSWERDPATWYRKPAYHGKADVVRLLRLAAAMVKIVNDTWPTGA